VLFSPPPAFFLGAYKLVVFMLQSRSAKRKSPDEIEDLQTHFSLDISSEDYNSSEEDTSSNTTALAKSASHPNKTRKQNENDHAFEVITSFRVPRFPPNLE
jgi:hypothetical protein